MQELEENKEERTRKEMEKNEETSVTSVREDEALFFKENSGIAEPIDFSDDDEDEDYLSGNVTLYPEEADLEEEEASDLLFDEEEDDEQVYVIQAFDRLREETAQDPAMMRRAEPRPAQNAGPVPMQMRNEADPYRSARPVQPPMQGRMPVPVQMQEPKPVKKHKGLKITGLVLGMAASVSVCAYGAVTYYFTDRFFPGTSINGVDCSLLTAFEAEQKIKDQVEDYSIRIESRNNEPESIKGSEIGYRYLSNGEVLGLMKDQKAYEWPMFLKTGADYSIAQNTTYDKVLLQEKIKTLACAQEENQVEPENAYVAYNGETFEIVPETEGSKLDIKGSYQIVGTAIGENKKKIDLAKKKKAYQKADITQDSEELIATKEACCNFTNASITYDFGYDSVTLDGSVISDWLDFDDKGQLLMDDASFRQHIADYVAQIASEYDTVGTTRTFTATNGRSVSVYGSVYGWQMDQPTEVENLYADIKKGAQVCREPAYNMTANARSGSNDFGNTYIEVDMGDQCMYYYKDGGLIFSSEFVSGLAADPSRMTPEGIYTLYYKMSPAVLRGTPDETGKPSYETPVTYWMPFNGGVGFHDATWQPYFGGDRWLYGGSHGCINLPYYAAAELYSIIEYDVPIICFY